MKFVDLPYERPDVKVTSGRLSELIKQLENAKSTNDLLKSMEDIRAVRSEFDTLRALASIRHSIDTKDTFYDEENKYFDSVSPDYASVINDYYQTLVKSNFKADLIEKYGVHFLNLAELTVETFKPEIIDLLKEENQLSSKYSVLTAQLKIKIGEEEYSLSNISPVLSSSDRSKRKEGAEALYSALELQQVELDELYHDLVQVRHKMALALGFENYVELGYKKLSRTDYNAKDVSIYRDAIHEYVVPAVNKLKVRQKKRLRVDSLKYYDAPFKFNSGNATPKGGADWIIENGKKMYKELSPETDDFFKFMLSNGLTDLEAKDGKMAGGYCTFISKYGYPFIFSNFNGTSHDIDVLTHEAGHAFQVYRSRELPIEEYYWPTLEACEIHSMSMEFFTYPWMKSFFKEDEEKYKFSHLSGSLSFLPYGAAIDEFQHFVYENPIISIKERNKGWLKIEAKYCLTGDKDGNSYLESGRIWQKQMHLYRAPFYYIDYTLAQVCAFQFWKRSQDDFNGAWADYLKLCDLGGSKPFTELVELAGLKQPFVKENLKDVIEMIDTYLDGIDDAKM
jgi:M3 family oligoendopeptidase